MKHNSIFVEYEMKYLESILSEEDKAIIERTHNDIDEYYKRAADWKSNTRDYILKKYNLIDGGIVRIPAPPGYWDGMADNPYGYKK